MMLAVVPMGKPCQRSRSLQPHHVPSCTDHQRRIGLRTLLESVVVSASSLIPTVIVDVSASH